MFYRQKLVHGKARWYACRSYRDPKTGRPKHEQLYLGQFRTLEDYHEALLWRIDELEAACSEERDPFDVLGQLFVKLGFGGPFISLFTCGQPRSLPKDQKKLAATKIKLAKIERFWGSL